MEWERSVWMEEYEGGETISEIARRHRVSRKAIYKWIGRYEEFGEEGLAELSRAPLHQPGTIDAVWKERIGAARQAHPRWGARKLVWWLDKDYGGQAVPSAATVGRVLKELGLSRSRKCVRQRGTGHLVDGAAANDLWTIDFKGWCHTGDGSRCEPLTVTDHASRFLLCCQGLPRQRTELVRPVLVRVFQRYGLPARMRSDNGTPFAVPGQCGLTELAVWWMELGIICERIEPGRPQQNGRHERMHRTLKQETMAGPARTLRQQQRRFDAFRQEYNERRPHEALGQEPPATVYCTSTRRYPELVPEPEYGLGWQIRLVADGGQIKWRGERRFLSHALRGKQVALEALAEDLWRIWFHGHWLGMWTQTEIVRPHEWEKLVARRSRQALAPSGNLDVEKPGSGNPGDGKFLLNRNRMS